MQVLHDICTDIGFIFTFGLILRLRPGSSSIAFLAPVCSSWVWISRYRTGRSPGVPLGFRFDPEIENFNVMVSRCILILFYLCIMDIPWVLEQPGTSIMNLHPRFQQIIAMFPIYRIYVYLSAYGGDSAKPTLLWSNCQSLLDGLEPITLMPWQRVNTNLSTRVWNATKERWDTFGRTKELVSSSAYPASFGRALARSHRKLPVALVSPCRACPKDFINYLLQLDGDPWDDACLASALALARSLR